MKLNLGCGNEILEGFVNVDLYNPKAQLKCDIRKLEISDNTVDEILACHVLEHFHFQDGFAAVAEWHRVLRPGGKIVVETPDFLELCRLMTVTPPENQHHLYGPIFGFAWEPGAAHLFGYTESQLWWTLQSCGFQGVKRILATSKHASRPEECVRMEGYKAL